MLTHKKRINKIKNYYLNDLNFFYLCYLTLMEENSVHEIFDQLSSLYKDINLAFPEFTSFICGLQNRKPKPEFLFDFHNAGYEARHSKSFRKEIADVEDAKCFKALETVMISDQKYNII